MRKKKEQERRRLRRDHATKNKEGVMKSSNRKENDMMTIEGTRTPEQAKLLADLFGILEQLTENDVQVWIDENIVSQYHCGPDKSPVDAMLNTVLRVK